MNLTLDRTIKDYVSTNRDRLVGHVRRLVQCPSENTPPVGAEVACQRMIAERLSTAGYEPDLYTFDQVPGLYDHPQFFRGREYGGRPNLAARCAGTGGGRSLILSGHIDTVPGGTQPWTRDPFSGHVDGNRLYGRGSNDMKAGVAVNLWVMEAVSELGFKLAGDLTFETVVDEEFGGVNGTLAGRLRGYHADAAVLSEPSSLRICAAQRGGRIAHLTFTGSGGILGDGRFPAGAIQQVTHFLNQVPKFAEQRRATAPVHPLYAGHCDPVPVSVTKIWTAPWGYGEPITPPEECRIEFYWQAMPGEAEEKVKREFLDWMDAVVLEAPGLFATRPGVEFPIRWLPGSAIDAKHPLVSELSAAAAPVLGREPAVVGIEGPCDMYMFHQFGIPAVLWGPSGGNTHAADEWVDLDSVMAAAESLLAFVCRWCGVAD
jgi:acetylornithine deacetylase